MYGEMFYSRHTAQHQLQWRQIKKWVPLRAMKRFIRKKMGHTTPMEKIEMGLNLFWPVGNTNSFTDIKTDSVVMQKLVRQ